MELISRQEAKAQGYLKYYTGKPCLRGHATERLVSAGHCCACQTERNQTPEAKAAKVIRSSKTEAKAQRAAYAKTPEAKAKETARRQASKYKTKAVVRAAAWTRNNPERKAARNAEYRKANSEKIAAYHAEWRKANSAAQAAKHAQYRAQKLKATPAWADRQAIKKIYDDCAFVSRVTGEKHHVDHRYPLQSDWVCGLHVIENLQILTATENISKGNRYVPSAHACT